MQLAQEEKELKIYASEKTRFPPAPETTRGASEQDRARRHSCVVTDGREEKGQFIRHACARPMGAPFSTGNIVMRAATESSRPLTKRDGRG